MQYLIRSPGRNSLTTITYICYIKRNTWSELYPLWIYFNRFWQLVACTPAIVSLLPIPTKWQQQVHKWYIMRSAIAASELCGLINEGLISSVAVYTERKPVQFLLFCGFTYNTMCYILWYILIILYRMTDQEFTISVLWAMCTWLTSSVFWLYIRLYP